MADDPPGRGGTGHYAADSTGLRFTREVPARAQSWEDLLHPAGGYRGIQGRQGCARSTQRAAAIQPHEQGRKS